MSFSCLSDLFLAVFFAVDLALPITIARYITCSTFVLLFLNYSLRGQRIPFGGNRTVARGRQHVDLSDDIIAMWE